MFKLRLAILGAAAALALGTAGALAMEAAGTNNDSHGDAVASAARHCPHGPNGVHGACVSAIASSNAREHDTSDSTNGRATAPGQVCKVAESTETEPTDRAAAKAEDRAEQKAFVACVKAHAAALSGTDESDSGG